MSSMAMWGEVAKLAGLPAVGALLAHLWGRYRRRLARVSWSADHVPMAFATPDTGFGRVEVLYNGTPAVNLHITRVLVRNTSGQDLTNLIVRLAFVERTRILYSRGFQPMTLVSYQLADRFASRLASALRPNASDSEIDFVVRNHEYCIPVLNRGGEAQFGLLVTRDDHERPTISLDISHPGVRVDYRAPGADAFGVPSTQAKVAGVVVGTVVVVGTLLLTSSPLVAGVVGWVAGAFLLALGALTVRMFRTMGNLLS